MIVSLIGYRGTGKSTVGKLLAERLGLDFLDSDDVLTRAAGQSIAGIFEAVGESGFRDLEEQVVADLMHRKSAVIAWGGGVVLRKSNRDRLRDCDWTIWLTAEPDAICRRINADSGSTENRPPLTDLQQDAEIRNKLAEREGLYREVADLTLSTDQLTPNEIADRIVAKIDPAGKNDRK